MGGELRPARRAHSAKEELPPINAVIVTSENAAMRCALPAVSPDNRERNERAPAVVEGR